MMLPCFNSCAQLAHDSVELARIVANAVAYYLLRLCLRLKGSPDVVMSAT